MKIVIFLLPERLKYNNTYNYRYIAFRGRKSTGIGIQEFRTLYHIINNVVEEK